MRRPAALVLTALVTAALLQAGGTAGAATSLQHVRTLRSLTGTHAWYVQTVNGIPVVGSYYARHTSADGSVTVRDATVHGVRFASARPSVSAQAARSTAAREGAGSASSASLAYLPNGRLVWVSDAVRSDGVTRISVDAHTGRVVRRERAVKDATGQGRVFDPNPVVALRNQSLTDQKDADYAAIQGAYVIRPLERLDGSGYLRGDFADVSGNSRARSDTLSFLFKRNQWEFEQTVTYQAGTAAQTYIQSLGFTDVNNEPQDFKVDQFGGDNSFYYPQQDYIKLGKGGVDDAEDTDVTLHEYGHAIQDSQVPGYGTTTESNALGEGFADYWAVTMSVPVNGGYEVPCVADWDSVSYTSTVPHCLRRVDLNLHYPEDLDGRIHHDGQIWSRALWDIQKSLGRTTADTIILEGQFAYTPDTTFRAAAQATVAAAQALYGSAVAAKVRKAFQDRGIL